MTVKLTKAQQKAVDDVIDMLPKDPEKRDAALEEIARVERSIGIRPE